MHAFRDKCLKSKQIQNEEMYINAGQKRGRNPSSPQAQNNLEKRIRQCVSSKFTVRHFDNTPTDTERRRSVALRVRASLFPSEDQTVLGEILPLPISEEATIISNHTITPNINTWSHAPLWIAQRTFLPPRRKSQGKLGE